MQLIHDYEAMVPFPLSLKKFTSWIQICLQSMLNLYPSEKSSLSIYLLCQIKQKKNIIQTRMVANVFTKPNK